MDPDDFKSQSGYVFVLNGGAFSCKSSKQDTIADSTTEAEYIAASEAAKEAVWIRSFIARLGIIKNPSSPVSLFCDNTGLRKRKSHDHITSPSIYSGVTISFERSLIVVT